MINTLRILFLVVGVVGLFGWVNFYTWALGQACVAQGVAAQDCTLRLPWQLTLKEASYMMFVPGFLVCVPFLLSFMLGGAASDELGQIQRRHAREKQKKTSGE